MTRVPTQDYSKSDESVTPRLPEYASDPFDASPTTASCAGLTRSPRPDAGKLKTGRIAKLLATLAPGSQHPTTTTSPLPVRKQHIVLLPATSSAQP